MDKPKPRATPAKHLQGTSLKVVLRHHENDLGLGHQLTQVSIPSIFITGEIKLGPLSQHFSKQLNGDFKSKYSEGIN